MAEICLVDPNTRQGKRTPVTLKIKFKSETLEQFIERYAVDVSQGGIFIRTKEPLAVGTQMKFEFQLRDASPLIAGEGTVVWTRENDPSRPAIAPGMGVRFDRLADGSQNILERILTEKAKQAPQRPMSDTARPPLFTDTPTRVAPMPVQDALLGKDRSRRGHDDGHNDSHTPLPKPMPFHSDADEFPDEAFEEATKVRALDELIAQTAEGSASQDELASRRPNGRSDATVPDQRNDRAEARSDGARPSPSGDGREAPDQPTPETVARPLPKLLDTSPSPRIESVQPGFVSESQAKTRLGVEPARGRMATPAPPISQPITDLPVAPPMPSGMRAVAAEQTEPARMPAMKSRSSAPLLILVLLLVAAGGAAVWFFVLRPHQAAERANGSNQPAGSGATPGSAIAAIGSAATGSAATGSAATGSAATGSAGGTVPAGSNVPKAELVDTVIGASVEHATVEITGTDQAGPAPFTAKLEKDRSYKVRVAARGFLAATLDVKGGDDKPVAKLVAKPRVISVQSDPPGALVFIDSGATGHTTPFDVELTDAQAAKKAVRVKLRKSGYLTLDRVVEIAKLTEDDTRMVTVLDEKLIVQTAANTAIRAGSGAGSAKGSAHEGSDAGSAQDGSAAPTAGSAQGSATPPPVTPPPVTPPPAGSATEPEPAFNKAP
jgi:uncharacterized protein (TIGR02266 family)